MYMHAHIHIQIELDLTKGTSRINVHKHLHTYMHAHIHTQIEAALDKMEQEDKLRLSKSAAPSFLPPSPFTYANTTTMKATHSDLTSYDTLRDTGKTTILPPLGATRSDKNATERPRGSPHAKDDLYRQGQTSPGHRGDGGAHTQQLEGAYTDAFTQDLYAFDDGSPLEGSFRDTGEQQRIYFEEIGLHSDEETLRKFHEQEHLKFKLRKHDRWVV